MRRDGCLTRIIVLFLACCAAFLTSFIFNGGELPDMGDFDTSIGIDTDGSTDEGAEDVDPGPAPERLDSYVTYYDQLDADEKHIYEVLLAETAKSSEEIHFEDVDHAKYKGSMMRALLAMTYDHPELFWVRTGYRITVSHERYSEIGDVTVKPMYYPYWQYTMNKKKKSAELEAAVEEVAALARRQQGDMERVRFVHDYLVKNAIYDHDALEEYYKTSHDAECEYIFSAYGCLVNGKTVCAGYAKAFQLIMDRLGYDCLYITGDAGGPHAWNCVFIEDEGYFIDVTWDDPDHDINEPKYDYYCITERELEKTHELDEDFKMPECTATEYNYYEYYGYGMDEYDFDKVCDVVDRQKGQRIISIRFGSVEALEDAYNSLAKKGMLRKIPALKNAKKLSYTYNEKHCTFTVYVK